MPSSLLFIVSRILSVRGRSHTSSLHQWRHVIWHTFCYSLSLVSSTQRRQLSVTLALLPMTSSSPTNGVARLSSITMNLTFQWWAMLSATFWFSNAIAAYNIMQEVIVITLELHCYREHLPSVHACCMCACLCRCHTWMRHLVTQCHSVTVGFQCGMVVIVTRQQSVTRWHHLLMLLKTCLADLSPDRGISQYYEQLMTCE